MKISQFLSLLPPPLKKKLLSVWEKMSLFLVMNSKYCIILLRLLNCNKFEQKLIIFVFLYKNIMQLFLLHPKKQKFFFDTLK